MSVMFVLVLTLLATCAANPLRWTQQLFGRHARRTDAYGSHLPYSTVMYNQTLDHFNYLTRTKTFQQRVLYNTQHWQSAGATKCPGPILFYTGNESPVTDYWDNSGFIVDVLAPKLGALVIFVEHRYFGKSLPFGSNSFQGDNYGYLTPEQALADYAHFLEELQRQMPYKCPVFSFGGSYGGMLTAWFRTKYPWVVMGGLAASAPLAFMGTPEYNPYAFMDTCEHTYKTADPACPGRIGQGVRQIVSLGASASGRALLSQKFKLCTPLANYNDAVALAEYFQGALVDMSMLDYSYSADYGVVFPAWPVNATCAGIARYPNDLMAGLSQGLQNFYNATGSKTCLDPAKDVPDWGTGDGWPVLSCSEMYFPMGQRGMWWPHSVPDVAAFQASCEKQFNIKTRPFWAKTQFGGFALSASSNIIFSSGLLDPWSSDSMNKSLGPTLPVVLIPESAHHFDLRGPNPADPIYVTQARTIEEGYITKWISEWFKKNFHKKSQQFEGDFVFERHMTNIAIVQ